MSARRLVPLLAVGLATLAFADPVVTSGAEPSCTLLRGAETETTDDDLEACRSDVWFHDAGTKVDNLDHAQGTFATWDDQPPTDSVSAGAGGGVAATSVLHQQGMPFDERESFVAEGRVEGALDAVVVELYLFPPAGIAQSETSYRVDAQLLLDGQAVASINDVTVPMETAGDAVQRIRFAIDGLADTIDLFADAGVLAPNGSGYDVQLRAHGTGIATNGAAFVYDTTEVPAGMVVNPPASLLAEIG